MTKVLQLLSVLSLTAISTPASSEAPMTYDCDTAAGAFSELKQVQTGPSYQLSGRITVRELRQDPRWFPVGTIKIEDSKGTSIGIQLVAEGAKDRTLSLFAGQFGGAQRKMREVGTYKLNEPVSFILGANGDSARLQLGNQSFDIPVNIEAGATVSVSCSTGQFLFEELSFQPQLTGSQ